MSTLAITGLSSPELIHDLIASCKLIGGSRLHGWSPPYANWRARPAHKLYGRADPVFGDTGAGEDLAARAAHLDQHA
jgi:hypothetical protein